MLTIDGAEGEGGGQILRSALALSLATSTPFRLTSIRAGRRRPGLLRQHLTALRAAVEVGDAEVLGDSPGSSEISFRPRRIRAGDYRFAVGTAGSANLVLQTILPALATADRASTITIQGGTHNPAAPPFDFLERCFAPVLARMGPRLRLTLDRPGFYPAGGGQLTATIEPVTTLAPIALVERGVVRRVLATAVVSSLPESIGHRELRVCARRLGIAREALSCVHHERDFGPGNVLVLDIETDALTEVITGFGERSVTAEAVAERASDEASRYLASDVPVGEHLADQLIVPFALAGAGELRTLRPTPHTTTQLSLVRRFLPVACDAVEEGADRFRISVAASR